MDIVVKIAKSLGSMDLSVLIGIGIFFVFLVLLILKGSILQTGLRIFTKKKYGFYFMIIPTFLAIFVNMILLFISYIVISTKFDIDILELIIQFLFNTLTDFKPILYILLTLIIAEVIFILIQSFILKLVTFDIFKSIKKLFSKLFNLFAKFSKKSKEEPVMLGDGTNNEIKNEIVSNDTTQEIETTNVRPSFVNGLLAGLFCFSIMVFLSIILLYVGEKLGGKLK